MARIRLREELSQQLTSAGIPIVGVSSGAARKDLDTLTLADQAEFLRIDYAPNATPEQIAAGVQILADFDPLDAVRAHKRAELRRETTAALESAGHDVFAQLNALAGRYSAGKAATIKAAVDAAYTDYTAAKAAVDSATTQAEIEGVTLGA